MSTSSPFPTLFPIINQCVIDYCVVAFGIVLIISLFQWIVDGRKNFHGPRIDIDELTQGVAIGQAPLEQEDSSEETREKKTALN